MLPAAFGGAAPQRPWRAAGSSLGYNANGGLMGSRSSLLTLTAQSAKKKRVQWRDLAVLILMVPAVFLLTRLGYRVLSGEGPIHALRGAGRGSWVKPSGFNGEVEAPFPGLKSLIMVAGHSVFMGTDLTQSLENPSWYLEDYQRIPGQAESFVQHIKRGIELADADPEALLLFSGGVTRRDAGPRSEGQTYWLVSDAAGWFGHPSVRGRAHTEEHARDSLENVLFSLCRFHELTGHYPERITVVSYDFKKERFLELHRAAVQFPPERFFFEGTPGPDEEHGQAGEHATLELFRSDIYGCQGTLLEKKLRRNPFAVSIPYTDTCPEMAGLMSYCGAGTTLYQGPLPWRRVSRAVGGRKFGGAF